MTREELEKTEWIHYGKYDHFDPKFFKEISNYITYKDREGNSRIWRNICKPYGGIWASPVDSDFGWKEWCELEGGDAFIKRTQKSFKFKLKPDSKIYTIDSVYDLEELNKKFAILDDRKFESWFDYEKMKNSGYDGLFMTAQGERTTRLANTLVSFYGWDCESIVVFNKDCIIPE